jgi:hypothetical protein
VSFNLFIRHLLTQLHRTSGALRTTDRVLCAAGPECNYLGVVGDALVSRNSLRCCPLVAYPAYQITGIILWFFNGIYSIALPLSQDIYEGFAIEHQGHRSAQIWIVKRRLVAV